MDDRELRRQLRQYEQRFGAIERSIGNLPTSPAQRVEWARPSLIKVTDKFNEPGGSGGKYTVLEVGYGGCTAKIKGDLAMPEGLTVPPTDDKALGINLAEDGKSGHALDVSGGNHYWFIGLCVGRTAKSGNTPDGLKIFVFSPGGSLAVLYGKLTADWVANTNAVTLQPCVSSTDGANKVDGSGTALPTITAVVQYPQAIPAVGLGATVNDILGYLPIPGATTGDGDFSVLYKLFDPPLLARAASPGMVLMNSSLVAGVTNWKAGWVQAHP